MKWNKLPKHVQQSINLEKLNEDYDPACGCYYDSERQDFVLCKKA